MSYNNTMNTTKRKVAIVGALNVDIGGRPEAAFVPGDSIPGQVITALGGVGWNIARDCASLGAETAFFSVLGQDEHEGLIRREAEEFSISLSGCRWEEQPNNRYLYISGKGGDMVAAVNDMRLCEKINTDFVQGILPALAEFDVVVADANLPPETFRVLAEGCGKPLVVDCVSAVKCGRLRDNLDRIHTIKANRMEAEMLTGQIEPRACVQALMEAGVTRAVVSLSGEGVLCGENGRIFQNPASGMNIVDTTGAGDSLSASLAVGLAYGLDLERCAALGMDAAGITMGQPGAVTKELARLALR
jgi:pseudouridine kinase